MLFGICVQYVFMLTRGIFVIARGYSIRKIINQQQVKQDTRVSMVYIGPEINFDGMNKPWNMRRHSRRNESYILKGETSFHKQNIAFRSKQTRIYTIFSVSRFIKQELKRAFEDQTERKNRRINRDFTSRKLPK